MTNKKQVNEAFETGGFKEHSKKPDRMVNSAGREIFFSGGNVYDNNGGVRYCPNTETTKKFIAGEKKQ
ncbi:MAG: hypothetical protein IPJ79_06890 [Bacteroidetes bacterium]|nr:hypothetical protein [Bacteroidota bacterium]